MSKLNSFKKPDWDTWAKIKKKKLDEEFDHKFIRNNDYKLLKGLAIYIALMQISNDYFSQVIGWIAFGFIISFFIMGSINTKKQKEWIEYNEI